MYSPPTDSLYKFLAISGVLITLFSAYFILKIVSDSEAAVRSLQFEIAVNKAEEEYLLVKINRLKEITDNSIMDQQNKFHKSKDRLTLYYTEGEIKSLTHDLYTALRDREISIAKLKISQEEKAELVEATTFYFRFLVLGFLNGIIMALYGFYLWYYKIQIYADKRIAEEHEKNRSCGYKKTIVLRNHS